MGPQSQKNLLYKKGNWAWINTLALEYGITSTKAQGAQKSTDKMELATQLGYTTTANNPPLPLRLSRPAADAYQP